MEIVEIISDLWDFRPDLRLKALLLSLVAMMAVMMRAYGNMSRARMQAGRDGRIHASDYAVVGAKPEPEDLALHSRLLVNLFELPPVFMILILAFVTTGIESWLTVKLAWLFVFFRFRHAQIMTRENRVMHRRKMFIRSSTMFIFMLYSTCTCD